MISNNIFLSGSVNIGGRGANVQITGLLKIEQGSANVEGENTSFTTQLQVDDVLRIQSNNYFKTFVVASIQSDTLLQLTEALTHPAPSIPNTFHAIGYVDSNLLTVRNSADNIEFLIDKSGNMSGSKGHLSELTVGGDILPGSDLNHNLGSPDRHWQSIYVGPKSIHFATQSQDLASISYNMETNQIEFVSGSTLQPVKAASFNLGLGESNTSGSVQIGQDTQGFIVVNGRANQFATILRAESDLIEGEHRMGSITQKGSGSFAILLDADNSHGNRAKFVVESNAAIPGVGPRLFSVSESMEIRAYGHLKVDNYITTTDITSSGTVHANTVNVENTVHALNYTGQLTNMTGTIDGGTF